MNIETRFKPSIFRLSTLLLSFVVFSISIFITSCNESPVTPPLSDNSNTGKSNYFRNSDFVNDINLSINENQIAEININEVILNSLNLQQKIFSIKYQPETDGEFKINAGEGEVAVEFLNSRNEIVFDSRLDNGAVLNLSKSEVYEIGILSLKSGMPLKLDDKIFVSTVKAKEGSAALNITLNTCNECLVTNETFTQSFNNLKFTNSEFYNCSFENIIMNENVFTGTLFLNCGFSDASVNVNNFENATFNSTNFINGTGFLQCNFNNSRFNGGNMTAIGFSVCSFLRANIKTTYFYSTQFVSCDMMYATISSPLFSTTFNLLIFQNTNFSNATLSHYNLQYSSLINSNFTNSNLTSNDMQYVNLVGSTFMNTNLSNSDLCGTKGTPAVFKGVIQTGTKCPIKQ